MLFNLWRKNGEHWAGCKNDADKNTRDVHQKEAEPITIDGGEDIGSVEVLADEKHVVSSHDSTLAHRGWQGGDGNGWWDGRRLGDGVQRRVTPKSPSSKHTAITCLARCNENRDWISLPLCLLLDLLSDAGPMDASSPLPRDSIRAFSSSSQSLAWASNSKQLFSLSCDGNTLRVDVSTGITLSKWPFIAVTSPDASLSFWDATSQVQIGPVVQYTHVIHSMANVLKLQPCHQRKVKSPFGHSVASFPLTTLTM